MIRHAPLRREQDTSTVRTREERVDRSVLTDRLIDIGITQTRVTRMDPGPSPQPQIPRAPDAVIKCSSSPNPALVAVIAVP